MNTYYAELPKNLLSHKRLVELADEYLDRRFPDRAPSYNGANLLYEIMQNGEGDMIDDNTVVTWFFAPSEYNDFCGKIVEYDKQTYDEDGEIDSYELLGFSLD